MTKNTFENKTTEQLKASLGMLKGITIVLAVVVGLLIIVNIYGLLTKEDNSTFIALFAVAISCGGMIPLQMINMKKIKAEIASRETM
ncbi:MAG: hypothetical protein ACJAVN_000369 [Roseivirga sp.]|jgi:hypothetical protein